MAPGMIFASCKSFCADASHAAMADSSATGAAAVPCWQTLPVLIQIDRVPLEIVQRDDRERFFVCCREHDRRRDAGIERLAPASGAETPAIAGLQTGKTDFRLRRGQIVATFRGEHEEFGGHARADDVQTEVVRTRVTAAVAEKAGARFDRAGLESAAQDVCVVGHDAQGFSAR